MWGTGHVAPAGMMAISALVCVCRTICKHFEPNTAEDEPLTAYEKLQVCFYVASVVTVPPLDRMARLSAAAMGSSGALCDFAYQNRLEFVAAMQTHSQRTESHLASALGSSPVVFAAERICPGTQATLVLTLAEACMRPYNVQVGFTHTQMHLAMLKD